MGAGDVASGEGEGAGAEEDALGEEMAQLLQQDALLQRLVGKLKEAQEQGAEALALAQSAADC